jgi:hypothetical protein
MPSLKLAKDCTVSSRTAGSIQWDPILKQEGGDPICNYLVSPSPCLHNQRIHKLLNMKQWVGGSSCTWDPWVTVWSRVGPLCFNLLPYSQDSHLTCSGYTLITNFLLTKKTENLWLFTNAYLFWVWLFCGVVAVKALLCNPLFNSLSSSAINRELILLSSCHSRPRNRFFYNSVFFNTEKIFFYITVYW